MTSNFLGPSDIPNVGDIVYWDGTVWRAYSGTTPKEFDRDIELLINQNTWSVYDGPFEEIEFTVAPEGHLEQRVQSYLIPAGTAPSILVAAEANLLEIDAFTDASDYLLIFSYFSGKVVGTGRIVV